MGKIDEKIIVTRLAKIKYLYKIGVEQSMQVETVAGFSLLSFHDCAEMFLLLIAEDHRAKNAGNTRRLTPLQRQFDALKAEQQQAINTLYGMDEPTVALIPIIKDLYATD